MDRSPLQRGFLVMALALTCLALGPQARATCVDGCLTNDNTALGDSALVNDTTGSDNIAIGVDALIFNTTGNDNTATGFEALFSNTTGTENTANGVDALHSNRIGNDNTATGFQALDSNTTGTQNMANGVQALFFNTTGGSNTASGVQALVSNTTGNNDIADGVGALYSNTTGSNNIAVGYFAGSNLTTGSNNIDIGALGSAGEANTIRIGKPGTQRKTFIAGIRGATVPNGVGVIVGTTGQLGTVVSSARFKEAIKPMDKASEAILALKPVTFRYKKELDPDKIPQFGLVAEEVEKVNPDLVARDEEGKIMSVRYEAVNAMLLNEFLKERKKVEQLESTIASLATTVKEQAAQIQKVSAQIELSKWAPQTVLNNH